MMEFEFGGNMVLRECVSVTLNVSLFAHFSCLFAKAQSFL